MLLLLLLAKMTWVLELVVRGLGMVPSLGLPVLLLLSKLPRVAGMGLSPLLADAAPLAVVLLVALCCYQKACDGTAAHCFGFLLQAHVLA